MRSYSFHFLFACFILVSTNSFAQKEAVKNQIEAQPYQALPPDPEDPIDLPAPSPLPAPPEPFIEIEGCGFTEVARYQSSGGITYYWQTSATGTSKSNSSFLYRVTSNRRVYLRAYRQLDNRWSAASYLDATVKQNPLMPTVANKSRCGSGAVTLSVSSPVAGTSYLWYIGSTYKKTGSSYTPTLSSTTTIKVKAAKDGCESSFRSTTATINPIPSAPSGSDNSRCGTGVVSLTASPGNNGNSINWYSGSTKVKSSSTTFNTPSLTANSTYTAKTYNTITGCQSATGKNITAKIITVPSVTSTIGASRIGAGNVTISATGTPAGISFKWNNPENGHTYTGSNYTVYVTQTNDFSVVPYNGGCPGPIKMARVNVTPLEFTLNPVSGTYNNEYIDIDGNKTYEIDRNGGTLKLTLSTNVEWSLREFPDWVVSSHSLNALNQPGTSTLSFSMTENILLGRSRRGEIKIEYSNQMYTIKVDQDKFPVISPTASKNYIVTIRPKEELKSLITEDYYKAERTVQYFDGLGRPEQEHLIEGAPDRADVVSFHEYDHLGREAKKYLPYNVTPTADARGGYIDNHITSQKAFYTNIFGSSDGPYAYSETRFDESPLNRPEEQSAPGFDWAMGNGHTAMLGYSVNAAAIASWIYNGSMYIATTFPAGSLIVNESYGEDYDETKGQGHTSREYIDKQGRTIISESLLNDGTALRTHYVYDYFGNVSCVIPPAASMPTDMEHCYFYRYDGRQRLIEKKIPGAEWVYMVYNQRNMLIATQDGNMRAEGKSEWQFTKYDVFDRPVLVGVIENTGITTQVEMQGKADLVPYTHEYITHAFNVGPYHGYSMDCFPRYARSASFTFPDAPLFKFKYILTINYYDNYDVLSIPGYEYEPKNRLLNSEQASSVGQYAVAPGPGSGSTFEDVLDMDLSPTGKTTVTKSLILDGTEDYNHEYLVTAIYYDNRGREVQSITDNYLKGKDRVSTRYNFAGEVLGSKHEHTAFDENGILIADLDFDESFMYDHAGRIISHNKTINNSSNGHRVYSWYNQLGQLSEKEYGNRLQNVNYNYNIRGWLTNINDPENLGNDLFATQLIYTNSENQLNISTVTPQGLYNGNISGIIWNNVVNTEPDAYYYEYDGINRLKKAQNLVKGTTAWDTENAYTTTGLSYDKNGNIKTLQRYGATALIDNLTYTYENNNHSNRLSYVNDITGSPEGFKGKNLNSPEYTYDANGNLDNDKNKGLDIDYNLFNLPKSVHKSEGNLLVRNNYGYDASGNKLFKETFKRDNRYWGEDTISYTYYVSGYEYVRRIIKTSSSTVTSDEMDIRQRNVGEGRIVLSNSAIKTEYHLTDHLGNVRVAFSDDNNNNVIETNEVAQLNDYYAFGMKHAVSGYPNNADQKYMYNGKEWDDGVEWYDYGFRQYEPALGRFMSIDPIADEFAFVSPFNYAENRPIDGIDLWGLQYVDYKTGEFLGPLSDVAAFDKGAILLPGFINEAQYQYQQQAMFFDFIHKYWDYADIGYPKLDFIDHFDFYGSFLNTAKNVHPSSFGGPGYGNGLARDPFIQMSAQMILFGGIGSISSTLTGRVSYGLFSGGMELLQQGASKQDFSLTSYDFANAGFKAISSGLMFNNQSSFLRKDIFKFRTVGSIGTDFLSSTIDLKYYEGTGFNWSYKFNSTGAIEFGYRSILGYGFDQFNFLETPEAKFMSGVSNKYLRSNLINLNQND